MSTGHTRKQLADPSRRMTALGGKADVQLAGAEWPVLTQSGH